MVGGRPRHRSRPALPRVVRQPARLRPHRAAVSRRKPVLALKAGTTGAGARAAGSHTAALAGSDAAADALFRQSGVLRAHTLEELLDAAALLSSQPLPQGRRVAILTNAGGLGILCADASAAAGLSLPELSERTRAALASILPPEASLANPIDLLGSAAAEAYERAIPVLLDDPAVDALVILFVPPVIAGAEEVATAIRSAATRRSHTKPIVAVVISADGIPHSLRDAESKVVAMAYPESPARALRLACDRAEWLRRPAGAAVEPAGIGLRAARELVDAQPAGADGLWLDPATTRLLLEAYGIPLVPERTAAGAAEAVAAARELGFPVVVKTAAAGAHKSEHGGVALDLRDDDQVRDAVTRIGAPVIVQPFVTGGVELLAGVIQDPVFGPLVAFGPGGVLAELIDQAEFRIAPLTDRDADELVLAGKAGRLVRGFRGARPADAAALADLVLRLGRLGQDLPEVAELDLNPVLGLPGGCLAIDARVRLARPPESHRLKSW